MSRTSTINPNPLSEKLPSGWTRKTLGEVVSLSTEKVDPVEQPEAPYIGLEHIVSGTKRLCGFGKAAHVRSTKSVFRAGDILYGKLRPYLNKVVRPVFAGVCSTDILVLRATANVEPAFIEYIVSMPKFVEFAMSNSAGINLPRTSYKKLADFPIPLPPLPEQRRIVARLEALEARSRRARAKLSEVPAQLAQARQSLLAAAFRGELTADWRGTHAPSYDVQGEFDGIKLAPLPATWRWVALEEIASSMKIGLVRSAAEQSTTTGVPYLRMQHYNLTGKWQLFDITRIQVSQSEFKEFSLQDGDILFNTRNSFELVGKVAIWAQNGEHHVFNNNLMRIRLRSESSLFVGHQMQSPLFAVLIRNLKSATTSVAAIYGRDIKRLPIAIAPLPEQHEIARRLSAAFAKLDAAASAHAAAVTALDRLDQSILARAFSGAL